jgi:hypothetical protein
LKGLNRQAFNFPIIFLYYIVLAPTRINLLSALLRLQGETITTFPKNTKLVLLVGGFIALTTVLLTYRQAIAQRMEEWQLLPRSERLTELFFPDYQKLPTHIEAGQTYSLTFTLRNYERVPTTYHYRVLASAGDADIHRLLEEGTLALSADESRTITSHVAIPALSGRTRVQVLVDFTGVTFGKTTPEQQTQSIHFWATGRPEANYEAEQ